MKKEIKIIVPESTKDSDKWYSYCPWCSHKSDCSTTMSSVCERCGGNTLILPCGTEIT